MLNITIARVTMAEQVTDKGYALIKVYIDNILFNSTTKDNKRPQCAVLSLHKTLDSAIIAQEKEIQSYGDNYRIEKRNLCTSVFDFTKIAGYLTYSRANKHLYDYCIVAVGKRLED